MAVQDLWRDKHRKPTKRAGVGLRWRVNVPGHPTRAFATREDAKAWEARLRSQSPSSPVDGTPVGELVRSYLRGNQHYSPEYVAALKAAADHVNARWRDVPAHQVDNQEVREWVASLQAQHGPRGEDGGRVLRPMATETRKRVLQVLRGALEISVQRGKLDTNPCTGVKPGTSTRRDAQILDLVTLSRLATEAGTASENDAAMIWALGTCGPRLSECLRLDVGDVDPARRRLRVRESKSGRPRDVPISGRVLEKLDLTRPSIAPLFPSAAGGRLDGDNWRARVFRPACCRAGLEGVRIHDLRHTAASLMILSGATIKDVQYALGHASAKTTLDLYGHLFAGHLEGVAMRMESLLEGGV